MGRRNLWQVIPLRLIMLLIRRERNWCHFNGEESPLYGLRAFWLVACIAEHGEGNTSLNQFLDKLDLLETQGRVCGP